jgi:proline iminopeptidase
MLCNGGAGCCDYLGPVAQMLEDMAKVVRFEQRGCGRSGPTLPYDIETCLADLENIRNYYSVDQPCLKSLVSARLDRLCELCVSL